MKRSMFAASVLIGSITIGACGGTDTAPRGMGTLVVQLTDAPFPTDSVKSVDIFVVRVDGRVEDVDEATADAHVRASPNPKATAGRRWPLRTRASICSRSRMASCRPLARPRSRPRRIADSDW